MKFGWYAYDYTEDILGKVIDGSKDKKVYSEEIWTLETSGDYKLL